MISLALIGAGNWGKKYLTTVQLLKNCEIKYVSATTKKTLDSIKGNYIKTTNYKDLFKFHDIDGVIVATPNATHFKIATEIMSKGYNLLIEKPIVEKYSQAVALKALQKNDKPNVVIGHTYLFDPAYVKAKELVNSIGKVRYISYDGMNNGPYRKGTSALWDIGPHAISLCLDIYPKKVIQVSAWAKDSLIKNSGYYDFCFIKLRYADLAEAYIKISWLFPTKKRELVIVGDKDTITYDANADKKVIYYKNMISTSKQKSDSRIMYPKYNSKTPLETELGDFIDAIKISKKPIRSSLDLGMEVTKIIELAIKSIKNNGLPINVPS